MSALQLFVLITPAYQTVQPLIQPEYTITVALAPPAHNAIQPAAQAALVSQTVHPLPQVASTKLTASAPGMMSVSLAFVMQTPANQCAWSMRPSEHTVMDASVLPQLTVYQESAHQTNANLAV